MSDKLLKNKVAIVTGASIGIGSQIAIKLAENGANIAIVYNKHLQEALKVKSRIDNSESHAEIFQCDLSKISSVKNTVKKILHHFHKIDILVNNAGIIRQTDFLKISEDEYDRILNTNLKGPFFLTKLLIPHLLKSKGVIVNLSSVGGQRGGTKAIHYALSKAAIISFTKSLSNMYASHGIRANAIAPGQIMTNMTKTIFDTKIYQEKILPNIPMRRVGTTEDIANTALFLVSDLSSYITGQTINVNGGEYLL